MDISMPVMDGYTAVGLLRANLATRDLPILAVTAHTSLYDTGELLQAGFDEMLLKPVAPSEIVSAVTRRVAAGR